MYIVTLEDILFPIAPKSIEMSINGNIETVSLVNEGEVPIIRLPKLTEINVDMRLPLQPFPLALEFKPVDYYLFYLEQYMIKKVPATFTVIRTDVNTNIFDTDMLVVINDYKIKEEGNAFIVISIKLIQYRDMIDKIGKLVNRVQDGKTVTVAEMEVVRPSFREVPNIYTAKDGDNFWIISKKFFDSPDEKARLMKLNGKSDTDGSLKAGEVIRLE